MLQRIIAVVAVVMALLVLGLLLLRTRGEPLELRRHHERLLQLDHVLTLESALDQEIARARLVLEAESPALDTTQQRLLDARQELRQHLIAGARLPAAIDALLRDYARQAEEKDQAFRHYREQRRSFVVAFQQLRRQSDSLLTILAGSQQGVVRRQLMSLLSELTTYSLQSRPDNGPQISALAAAISAGARQPELVALRAELDRLLWAVDSVRSAKDAFQSETDALLAVSMVSTLEQVRHAYYEHYENAEASQGHYRRALAIYAAALLMVFGLIGWRLRASYGDLDRINATLQDTNSHLEDLVQARTIELRKALDDLKQQQVQLIQSEKMASLGQLVAGVAHEINTPLGYARSNVQTLQETLPALRELLDACGAVASVSDSVPDAALKERLGSARNGWNPLEGLADLEALLADADHGLGQIAELVMSLKDFSRLDRSQTEHFDINEGLDTAIRICQSHFRHRIAIERDYGVLPKVPCAPSQLNQVFLNLLANAAQAIEGEGCIRLSTRDLGGQVQVTIADTGCGMDEETQAHIFEPFFTTKDVGQGTGLGLSIVFRIIEDHRGSIRVRSKPGEGSEFTVRLPTQLPTADSSLALRALDDEAPGLLSPA